MAYKTIEFKENGHNISVVKRMAGEQDFSLQKVRNKDLWNLKDEYGDVVQKNKTLEQLYDYLSMEFKGLL